MGFLARLHDQRSEWKGPYSSRLFGSGYEASSGIVVTDANAFTFSAVFSAVLQISSDVAKLPLNLLKRRKDGLGSDHYVDSRLYYLLKQEPNPEMSSMTFRQMITAHALTCHGGYAEIERDINGRPVALWLLTPDRVEPFRREQHDRSTGRKTLGPLEYRIDGSDDTILPARDVLHISGLGYDGITGYSVINKARQAIGLALAMEKFGGQYFGKGTVFGGWLETDSDLDEEQKAEIKTNIENFRKAQDSAWRVLVTGAGHKFHQFSSKPAESQMDESRVAQVLEVARFFRMPPVKLGVNTPGAVSYASSEQADLDYYKGPMLDWITREEQEYNRKLIPKAEQRQQYVKHNATAFLRADTAGRTAFYEKMLTHGVFNADDVLALEDLNPQPNGQGQLYLVQGAMIAKDQLVTLTEAKIDKLKAPPPAPALPPGDPTETDAARALGELAARVAEMVGAVSTLSTDQRTRIDELQAELETARLESVRSESAAALATAQAETFAADRDRALARATEADTIAATATTERTAAQADATQARTEATAATLAAAEAERIRQEAVGAREAVEAHHAELAARVEALGREIAEARAAAATAERARADAAAVAIDERARREREVADAITARAGAVADADGLRAQLAEADAVHTRELAARAEDAAAARVALEAAQAALGAAEATLQQTGDERAARIQALTADVDRLTADLVRQTAADEEARARQASEREGLAAAVTTADAAAETLRGRVAELEAAAAASATAADEARRHLDGERAARIERLTRVVAAHRRLIADVIGRMARRECQQARAKQATPEKLRRWLDGFVSVERPLCVEALQPALGVVLAARGTTDDPAVVAERLASEHLQAFEAVLRAALDEQEDFHAELDRVLTRWEQERPERVADALLEEEIRHVRAL